MRWVLKIASWLTAEYMRHYSDSRVRVFDTIIKNNLQLNTIILTVSVASLTAIAALNDRVFTSYPYPSMVAVGLFIIVILLSTINFFLSGLALRDLQQKLSKDILLPVHISGTGYRQKFKVIRNVLNVMVLAGFCTGLLVLLILLSFYIMEPRLA